MRAPSGCWAENGSEGNKAGSAGDQLGTEAFHKEPNPWDFREAKQRTGMQHVGGAAASQVESAYGIVESDPGRTGVGVLEIGTAGREGAQVRLRGHWVTKEFKRLP